MSAESKAILKFIGACSINNTEVCVKDITQNARFQSSPVTLLKRVHELCDAGWLIQGKSENHHRRVTLRLSAKAQKELNTLSHEIELGLSFYLRNLE